MRDERLLLAFLVTIMFALAFTIAFVPVRARASTNTTVRTGMSKADYADLPNATTTPTAKAVPVKPTAPTKTVTKKADDQAIQVAELIRKIKELRELIAKYQRQR